MNTIYSALVCAIFVWVGVFLFVVIGKCFDHVFINEYMGCMSMGECMHHVYGQVD